jgi:hypothetical protein
MAYDSKDSGVTAHQKVQSCEVLYNGVKGYYYTYGGNTEKTTRQDCN